MIALQSHKGMLADLQRRALKTNTALYYMLSASCYSIYTYFS